MRTFIGASVWMALAALTMGCSSGGAKPASDATPVKPAALPSRSTPGMSGPTKSCLMASSGRDVLRLTIPADTTCTPEDGAVHLRSPQGYADVWLVPGARTVDEAAAHAGPQITSEFKNFKPGTTTPITIAGSPALRVLGSGVEADDNDPGTADLIIFQVADCVFVACTHGESLAPSSQQFMMSVVQSAQKP